MASLDEDDEGEISFGESPGAEREPTPDVPQAPSVKTFDDGETSDDGGDFEDASDLDSDTLRAFVVAVIYANAAVLLVALGPMVWYFEGWSRVGPVLLVAGLLSGVRTYQTYRAWKRSRDETGADGDGDGDKTDDMDAATADGDGDKTDDMDAATADGDGDKTGDTDAATADGDGNGDREPPEA